jgi:hypothetical protein
MVGLQGEGSFPGLTPVGDRRGSHGKDRQKPAAFKGGIGSDLPDIRNYT